MGEEEKVAAEVAEGGTPDGTPDLGMPGGFEPTGGGGGITISQKIFYGGITLIILVFVFSVFGSYRMGKMKGLLKEGTIQRSNRFLGPVYPIEEIKTNIFSNIPMDVSAAAEKKNTSNEHILELKVNLVLNDDLAIDEVNKRYPQIIDQLFYLVQKKSYEELDSLPDQNRFKRLIRDELNAILQTAKVKEVYFEKFRILPLMPTKLINWDKKK